MKAATALQLHPKKISSGAEARKIDGKFWNIANKQNKTKQNKTKQTHTNTKHKTQNKNIKKKSGIGVKIEKKIDEILKTGKLQKLEKLKKDSRLQAIHLLSKVIGIG